MKSESRSKHLNKTQAAKEVGEAFRERIDMLSHQVAEVGTNLDELALLRLPATFLKIENGLDLYDEVRRFEVSIIRAALKHTRGSQTMAARLLRVRITTLNSKLKTYNIAWREYSAPPLDDRSGG